MILKPKIKLTKAQLRSRLRKAARDKEFRQDLGDLLIDDISKRTFRRLKSSEPYYEFRERVQGKSPKYKRGKLNLFLTGQLMKDLASNVKTTFEKGRAIFTFQNSSKRAKPYRVTQNYTTKRGKKKSRTVRIGRRLSSTDLKTKKTRTRIIGSRFSDIQKGLIANGYDYLEITKSLRLKIRKRATKLLRKALNRRI